MAHPKTNGQVERVNGCILLGLKPRIFRKLKHFEGRWVQELQLVLWGLRTTPTKLTGFTPFFLIYGVDAVLPEEIGYASPQVRVYDEDTAEEALQASFDRPDEHRGTALVRSARYQQQLRKYHSKHVRPINFMQGDLVLR